VVLVGIESHICVTQTAVDLLGSEYDVFLAEDAISARSSGMHTVAMQRLRDIGAVITHTESVVYEAMGGADHGAFRDVLGLVKRFAG
jgi:nicotinamidase-related amidase